MTPPRQPAKEIRTTLSKQAAGKQTNKLCGPNEKGFIALQATLVGELALGLSNG